MTRTITVAGLQNKSISENARAFALLNMAIMDALISVFDTKYQYKVLALEAAFAPATRTITRGPIPIPLSSR
jgi:hypothetical protein